MFRIRDPQESLWQSQFLGTPKKAKRLERSWAEVFRNEALPLIDEERLCSQPPSQPGGADRPRGPPPQRDVSTSPTMKLWNN